MAESKTSSAETETLADAYNELAAATLLQRSSALLKEHYGPEWLAPSHSDELTKVAAAQRTVQHATATTPRSARNASSEDNSKRLVLASGDASAQSVAGVDTYLASLLPSTQTPHSWLSHWRLAQYLADIECDQLNAEKHWKLAAQQAPPEAMAALRGGGAASTACTPAGASAESKASSPVRRPSMTGPSPPLMSAVCLFWAQYADWKASHAHDTEAVRAPPPRSPAGFTACST